MDVVRQTWHRGVSIQGDFARSHAVFVAMAASLGYVTTMQASNEFSKVWRVTSAGLRFLEEQTQ